MAARLHYTKKRYADIPSHTLPGGVTVPPHLLVTAEKPELKTLDYDILNPDRSINLEINNKRRTSII